MQWIGRIIEHVTYPEAFSAARRSCSTLLSAARIALYSFAEKCEPSPLPVGHQRDDIFN